MTLTILFLSIVIVGIAVAAFAIRMFLVKGGEFKKGCSSSIDPKTGKPMPCHCRSKTPGDTSKCENTN